MSTYLHVYTLTCLHTYMSIYLHVYTLTCQYTYMSTHLHVNILTCLHTYMSIYLHVYTLTCQYTYMSTHLHVYTLTYLHTYISTHLHVYVCTYLVSSTWDLALSLVRINDNCNNYTHLWMQINAVSTGRPNLAWTCRICGTWQHGTYMASNHTELFSPETSFYLRTYTYSYPHILCVSHIHKSRREPSAVERLRKRNSLVIEVHKNYVHIIVYT